MGQHSGAGDMGMVHKALGLHVYKKSQHWAPKSTSNWAIWSPREGWPPRDIEISRNYGDQGASLQKTVACLTSSGVLPCSLIGKLCHPRMVSREQATTVYRSYKRITFPYFLLLTEDTDFFVQYLT